ncbi:OadG family protein [Idiomarina tyrosinivorans]|uniref:OadG family protein n=1 Tax=Idiomarina tyrosinivorans TaxID=1445662 RepID=UPI0018E54305|nr:OadG family transporter subunit [Idiomarina tyrosinivorans]
MSQLLAQAAELMLIGMSSVLLFLLLLIAAMKLLKTLFPYFPDQPQRPTASAIPSRAMIAAVTAAVHQHHHAVTKEQSHD